MLWFKCGFSDNVSILCTMCIFISVTKQKNKFPIKIEKRGPYSQKTQTIINQFILFSSASQHVISTLKTVSITSITII